MHRLQLITWTTHTAENTTLLDYKKLYSTLHYITLRSSVRHHFRMKLYHFRSYRVFPYRIAALQFRSANFDWGFPFGNDFYKRKIFFIFYHVLMYYLMMCHSIFSLKDGVLVLLMIMKFKPTSPVYFRETAYKAVPECTLVTYG